MLDILLPFSYASLMLLKCFHSLMVEWKQLKCMLKKCACVNGPNGSKHIFIYCTVGLHYPGGFHSGTDPPSPVNTEICRCCRLWISGALYLQTEPPDRSSGDGLCRAQKAAQNALK